MNDEDFIDWQDIAADLAAALFVVDDLEFRSKIIARYVEAVRDQHRRDV